MVLEKISAAAHGEDHAGPHGYSQRNCHLWGAHTGAVEKCDRKITTARNYYVLTITFPNPLHWEGGRGVWSKGLNLSLARVKERC